MKKRLIAMLLAMAMVLCLFGCTGEPAPTEPDVPMTETTGAAANEGLADYEAASAVLNAADVTLDVTTTRTTMVGDQTFTETSAQVLTYTGVGTDAPVICLEETVPYWDYDVEGNIVAADTLYREIYDDGVLYMKLENQVMFSAEVTAQQAQLRYVPAVLLDSTLYEDVIAEVSGGETTLTFTKPSGSETWAVPAEAEMVESTGTATVTDGSLHTMSYTVTYQYGPVTVTQTTESKPRQQVQTVLVPENADKYAQLQSPDALYMFLQTTDLLSKVNSATAASIGSIYCQAAATVINQSVDMDCYGKGEELVLKVNQANYVSDYYYGENETYEQEEIYLDGRYTLQVDDGVPTTWTQLEVQTLENYSLQILQPKIPEPKYWQDVTVEDLGSLYYLEFAFSEDFGNAKQNNICSNLWDDPTYLNQLASAYKTDEVTGYLSIDKYTGLLVASGTKYQGTHTIDGQDWIMTEQNDQVMTLPSFGAYKEVTGELPPETEPEQKATPLFYHVTGDNGQEMWLLGTIHVGDTRTAYLPQPIYDAFAASDALALECDTEAFDEQLEENDELQAQISDLYYYSDGSTIGDHIDPALHERAAKYLKATGGYNMNADYMKPSVWSDSIELFFLQQGRTLTSEQGVEERLTKLAHEQEKKILEVESSLFQIQMITGWSEDLQEELLAESLDYSGASYFEGVNELYALWCDGDETALREHLSTEVDTSEMTEEELAEYEEVKPLMDEYNKTMSTDRNEGMLDKAIEYLESGDVIFFAVGLAHLLDGTNGLVDTLREAGYTVELVSYS